MAKIMHPNRKFIYLSPLKDCKNETAKLLASLIESFMLENISIQIDMVECKVKQAYDYTCKEMEKKGLSK